MGLRTGPFVFYRHVCTKRHTWTRIDNSEYHNERLPLGEHTIDDCNIGNVEPAAAPGGLIRNRNVGRCSRVDGKDGSANTYRRTAVLRVRQTSLHGQPGDALGDAQ